MMSLDYLVALMTAVSLQANASTHAIPVSIATRPLVEVLMPPAPPVKQEGARAVDVSARSAIVVDVGSGEVLWAKDAEAVRPMASLTKLLTAMVVLDQGLRGEEAITVDARDFVEARPELMAGDTLTREVALRAMLVGSVNELANAFARTSEGGKEAFMEAMHAKAVTLGLTKTSFVEPTGINPRNTSTAADVARVMRAALGYPVIRQMTTEGSVTVTTEAGKVVNIDSTNLLLPTELNRDPYRIIAGKTGSLPEAGYCLAQVTQNAEGKQVIVVGMGSVDHFVRFTDVRVLTTWVFESFTWSDSH
jgi:D-alanyl-D-alanine endopeptidase (penicillin-binding protein 7)